MSLIGQWMLSDEDGRWWMIWTVRVAVAFYLARLLLFLRQSPPRRPGFAESLFWSVGCLFYFAHVALAFQFEHAWSHGAALDHTAQETERVTGIARGEGIWVNYLFTIVWAGDAARLWIARRRGRHTDMRLDLAIQSIFGFIVFNATVVFGPPVYRYLAVPVGLLLCWAIWNRTDAIPSSGSQSTENRANASSEEKPDHTGSGD